MPSPIAGFNMEQKVLTVVNSDEDINEAITAQAAESWMVASLTLSGSDVIILFTRTIVAT